MVNSEESKRWLNQAENCLISAQKTYDINEFRLSVQQGQSCIELSCKAIIAQFEEPKWTHAPGSQLYSIIEDFKNSEDLSVLESLRKLAAHANEVENWHAWSVYGKEDENGKWVSASDLCTTEIARKLLEMAKISFEIASTYLCVDD